MMMFLKGSCKLEVRSDKQDDDHFEGLLQIRAEIRAGIRAEIGVRAGIG